jgi:TetR/AcrR family transcriptional repressor of bet genes
MANEAPPTRADAPARRTSLIAATARVLARGGAGAASVRAIAAEAGVSPGLVTHHFGGVDALVAATYAQVDADVAAALDLAVAEAGEDPRARLLAYLGASFAPPIGARDLLATWIAFWSLTIARRDVAALHDAHYAGYRARLEALLGECGVAPAARRRAAIGLAATVDGLWLESCLSPHVVGAAEARAILAAQVAALLPAPPSCRA